MDAGNKLVAIH